MPAEDPFRALLDRSRAAEEVASRSRARWLRRQAEESASLVGTLLDLAEAGTLLGIRTASGRAHRGRIAAVGTDFVVLHAAAEGAPEPGPAIALATAWLASVRPQRPTGRHPGRRTDGTASPATGDRPPALDVRLVELLADIAPERPRLLAAVVADTEPLVGELVSVGVDVVTLALDGGARPAPVCYVPVESLTEVAFTSG